MLKVLPIDELWEPTLSGDVNMFHIPELGTKKVACLVECFWQEFMVVVTQGSATEEKEVNLFKGLQAFSVTEGFRLHVVWMRNYKELSE